MTQNQINYAKLREEQRHNLATEGYTGIELQETRRHNVAGENENARHNVASESINWYSANEAGRHNLASESLNWYMVPSQVEANYANAYRQQAAGMYDSLRGEDIERRYELDKQKIENDLYAKLKELAIKESQYELSETEFMKNAEKIDATIADLFYRQGLDFEQYQADYLNKKSQAFRNYAQGSKEAVDALMDIFNWAWGLAFGQIK